MKSTTRNYAQTIAFMGLMVAIEVICSRFLSIRTPIITIGIGYIPLSFAAMKLGAAKTSVITTTADLLGATLFPSGPFFPGFTLTAFLKGLTYGYFLKRKEVKIYHIIIMEAIIHIGCNLFLNSIWLTIIHGKGLMVILPPRIIKTVVLMPVQILVIWGIYNLVKRNKILSNYLLAENV